MWLANVAGAVHRVTPNRVTTRSVTRNSHSKQSHSVLESLQVESLYKNGWQMDYKNGLLSNSHTNLHTYIKYTQYKLCIATACAQIVNICSPSLNIICLGQVCQVIYSLLLEAMTTGYGRPDRQLGRRDFFSFVPALLISIATLSACSLTLFLWLISIVLFPCTGVRDNTRTRTYRHSEWYLHFSESKILLTLLVKNKPVNWIYCLQSI